MTRYQWTDWRMMPRNGDAADVIEYFAAQGEDDRERTERLAGMLARIVLILDRSSLLLERDLPFIVGNQSVERVESEDA